MAMAADEEDDRIPPIYREIEKEAGVEQYTTKQVKEAFGQEREGWRQALEQELISFREKETFSVLPEEERAQLRPWEIYPMQIVAGIKPADATGVRRMRARGVVCGNFEPDGGEPTYCSNLDIASLRATLALATKRKWSVGALDISVAFLNANLPIGHKRVVVRPPALMVQYGLVAPNELWVAHKAIYGLRSSPKAWSDHRDQTLAELTFETKATGELKLVQSYADPAVWTIVDDNGEIHGYMLSYVDDFLFVGNDDVIAALQGKIASIWKVSVQETISQKTPGTLRYLSIDVTIDKKGTTSLSQAGYCSELLEKWGMDQCKGTNSINLDKETVEDYEVEEELGEDEKPLLADVRLAQKMSGGLLWLASRTRPDIAFAVSRVASLAASRPKQSLCFGKKVLRYLAASRTLALEYAPQAADQSRYPVEVHVETFADASLEDVGSQTGVATFVSGYLVDWRSVRQQVVAFSTCEAEVNSLAMGECMQAAVVTTLESMGVRCHSTLYGDNTAANQVAEARGTWRTRSLSTKVNALRTRVQRGLLELQFVATKEQRADGLTKCGGVIPNKLMREHFGLALV